MVVSSNLFFIPEYIVYLHQVGISTDKKYIFQILSHHNRKNLQNGRLVYSQSHRAVRVRTKTQSKNKKITPATSINVTRVFCINR